MNKNNEEPSMSFDMCMDWIEDLEEIKEAMQCFDNLFGIDNRIKNACQKIEEAVEVLDDAVAIRLEY